MGTASRSERRFPWTAVVAWLAALALVSAAMVPVRTSLEKTHVTLTFLLLVLAASGTSGKIAGLSVAFGAFLAFDFLFLPPFNTLALANPLDWLVLAAFLVTAIVAASLLDLARRRADEARHRSAEVERLAALGAEALNAPRAELAVAGVEAVIRETLRVTRCTVHRTPPDGTHDDLVSAVLQQGGAFTVLRDGATRRLHSDPRLTGEFWSGVPLLESTRLLLPLRVRDRVVGALDLEQPAGFTLDAAQQRLLDAMSFYAALGVERIRLEANEAHTAALEEADRLKDNLIASVSHDLRTPLTTIKALAHGMQSHGDERADIIEQEADRLNRMVGDLLNLSRLSAGGVRLSIEPVPVDELVTGAVQQVEGALGAGRLDVSLGDHGLLVGRFDLVHSIRILVNLIENAAKYAPPVTPVTVRVARRDAWIEVSVADRGPGVEPNEAERIFQPLYRPEHSPPDRGSAGLGLAIARQFAEAQGGSVTFMPREGGGSVFTLRLPSADA